jgi:hypothetical protein
MLYSLFCHCNCNVAYILWLPCLSLVLCVAVLIVSEKWFCFYTGSRACVLLTGVISCIYSEYWVMCISVCAIHVCVIFTDFLYVLFS